MRTRKHLMQPVAVIVCAGLSVLLAHRAIAQEPARLTVRIDGRQGSAGDVRCLLFANAAGFPDDPTRAVAATGVPLKTQSNSLTCTFALPAGPCAVAVMHDQNRNGRLDRNLLGMPTEGYAFSRDVRPGLFGPPSFAAAALPADGAADVVVHLVYP